ncbi:hypothetical protein CPC16_000568 [Podila verticillata]|nr:hypothetical protein BGZ52_011946 [Haplosporangium bisporale]KAF9216790.1 hypothetical protein BGZ59_008056 [Podila verticillata]KAF9375689.1 hypothetical protein CPC16_000568 [Podila verticillata]KFH73366.1 hypothetical protein MVEG_00582 [Podila verticillata NRRL 6337]
MALNNEGYIHIEEDCSSTPVLPAIAESSDLRKAKIVNLRNVAMTPAVYATNPKDIIRVKVLDTIMPLSRTPWTNAHSVIKPTSAETN